MFKSQTTIEKFQKGEKSQMCINLNVLWSFDLGTPSPVLYTFLLLLDRSGTKDRLVSILDITDGFYGSKELSPSI